MRGQMEDRNSGSVFSGHSILGTEISRDADFDINLFLCKFKLRLTLPKISFSG